MDDKFVTASSELFHRELSSGSSSSILTCKSVDSSSSSVMLLSASATSEAESATWEEKFNIYKSLIRSESESSANCDSLRSKIPGRMVKRPGFSDPFRTPFTFPDSN